MPRVRTTAPGVGVIGTVQYSLLTPAAELSLQVRADLVE
jgi:hypothetical protein